MSPEELLAALTEKEATCRELLSDMRSMEKTLRATVKESKTLIDDALVEHIKSQADAMMEDYKAEFVGLRTRVESSLESHMTKMALSLKRHIEAKMDEVVMRLSKEGLR